MIEMRRVLCPIDFSEYSRHALRHAVEVARWYRSSLTVLHVVSRLSTPDEPGLPLTDIERDQLLAEMRSFTGETPPEVAVAFVLRQASDVRHEIVSQARALMSDLLVIGSHGRSGFERLLLGSVTEKVVRKSPCPVMVVPAHTATAAGPGLIGNSRPHILCAVDFSDASLAALEYAISLSEEADADLLLLHSIEVPPELLEHIPVSRDFNVDQLHAEARAASLNRLRTMVPPSARTYCHVDTTVAEGAAYRQILKTATEQPADLIVMGVHGRGAVDVLLFGSNTARVIRAATCPVLIVPPLEGRGVA
jgi:nucleotide-binding universal stress UspA family protein